MTERKSVIKVDVLDAGFQRLAKAMEKFRIDNGELAKELAKTAEVQEKVNTAKKTAAQATRDEIDFQKTATAAEKEALRVKEAEAKAEEKVYRAERERFAAQSRAMDQRRKDRADDIAHFRDAAKWTADIARNVASTAWSAAKWVTLSSIASGFGLGGLASNAASVRRASQGLGVDTGAYRAASVNFGRFVDPQSTLSNIADAQSDRSKRWIFNALGQNTQGKNAGDILPEILPKLVDAFKAGGSTLQGAQARGLDQLVGIDDLRRLSAMSKEELTTSIAAYKKDRESLLEGGKVGRVWQDFLTSLHRASEGIEVTLLKSLSTLTPFLTQFADGIAKAIEAFASNGGLQRWIEAVGRGLERLGKYLGSPEFSQDVDTFISAISRMAKFLGKLFQSDAPDAQSPAALHPNAPKQTLTQTAVNAVTAPGRASAWKAAGGVYGAIWDHLMGRDAPLAERNHNPGNLRVPGSTTEFQKFSSDAEGLRAMARQLMLYENRDGLQTLRGIISKYAPGNENNTAAYIAAVSQRTGLKADQQLTPGDPTQLASIIAAMAKQENNRSGFTTAGVKVIIENSTGGSAQATVAALQGN